MSESQGSVDSMGVSRRTFLKGAVAAGVPGIAIKHEYDSIEQGIETDQGRFFPVLENHRQGIDSADLPDNLDYFFREVQPNYDAPAEAIISSASAFGPNLFSESVLGKLHKDNASIVLGDIRVPEETQVNESLTMAGVTITGVTALASAGYIKAVEMLKAAAEQEVPRRTVLNGVKSAGKKALGIYGLWATTPAIATAVGLPTIFSFDQKSAIDKIAASVSSISSQLHPEFPVTFFRNLIIADKLLFLAETYKTKHGEKPRIAFNVGSHHAGINNYLIAGREVTQFLISSYDRGWVNRMIEANNGVDNASSVRIVNLGDPNSPTINISESKVTDPKLATTLTGMLPK